MPTLKSEMVMFRARPFQTRTWKAVATTEDVSLSEFLRRAADEYAQRRLATSAQRLGTESSEAITSAVP